MDKIISAEEKLAQHQLEEFLSFTEPPSDVYVLLKRAYEILLKKDEKITELENKVTEFAAWCSHNEYSYNKREDMWYDCIGEGIKKQDLYQLFLTKN